MPTGPDTKIGAARSICVNVIRAAGSDRMGAQQGRAVEREGVGSAGMVLEPLTHDGLQPRVEDDTPQGAPRGRVRLLLADLDVAEIQCRAFAPEPVILVPAEGEPTELVTDAMRLAVIYQARELSAAITSNAPLSRSRSTI